MLVHSDSVWTAKGAGYARAPDSQRKQRGIIK